MDEQEQIPSSLDIQEKRLKTCLGTIRESVKPVWTRLVLPHYTNHGIDHSERIIEKLGKLLEDYSKPLNDYERFILLAAAYLHDIGMQSPVHAGLSLKDPHTYTTQELEQIREKHNESSEKMINDSVSGKLDYSLGLEQCREFVNYIAIIAKYHRNEDITKLKDKSIANKKVRLPLLASLLRLGDELDGDFCRVNIDILKFIDIPVESKFHWWSHHYVQSIFIENGIITIIFRFPKDYSEGELIKILRDEIYESVKNQFNQVYDIFYSCGLKLHPNINKDEECSESGLELVPDDLYEYIINKISNKTSSIASCESHKVLLQRLLNFTVQIRNPKDNSLTGTGIIVSTDGKIATCSHVVKLAGVNPRQINGEVVRVYLPKARSEDKNQYARVIASPSDHDDDIVLLQLVGNLSFLEPEQIAKLGNAELSIGHNFHSYGYNRFGSFQSGYINGAIMGPVAPTNEGKFLVDPVELRTDDEITQEMNGAAILDLERNLVVGLLTQQYKDGDSSIKHNAIWAINASTLAFEPMNIPILDEPYLLDSAPQPKVGIEHSSLSPYFNKSLNNAPSPLTEWVGRDDLLEGINKDWSSFDYRVTGLIGFGGEGKSSLACEWLDKLLKDQSKPQPDGIFWWGFYDRRNVDEFFEAALNFMFGGKIDPRQVQSSNAKAHLIGGMLSKGRYIFILDGLDVIQHQEGDQYGMLRSAALKEFLGYFAASWHSSFCLVTSRAPMLDLIDYVTYKHRDVGRLSLKDGVSLLINLGVVGSKEKIGKVVEDWGGHALTLSLLGPCLAELYKGDIRCINEIPVPTADEPRYDRVKRVLRHYDEHLSDAERAFLKIFSVFRSPVKESIFRYILVSWIKVNPPYCSIFGINGLELKNVLEHLMDRRILRYNPKTSAYMAHPLIKAHYFSLFINDFEVAQFVYKRIKEFYLKEAQNIPNNPTLDELMPLIEAIHYACNAGAYDDALGIVYKNRNLSGNVIIHQLGAYETGLAMMSEFFQNGDILQDPEVRNHGNKAFILNNLGLCLTELGRPVEAIPYFERAIKIDLANKDWLRCIIAYRNLAESYIYLGSLVPGMEAISKSLELARRTSNADLKVASFTCKAWIAYLQGNLNVAKSDFHQAEVIQRRINQKKPYLDGRNAISFIQYLCRTGRLGDARRIAEFNLKSAERNHAQNDISLSHRLLGDIDAKDGKYEYANIHYDEAIKAARNTSSKPQLIDALISKGRVLTKYIHNTPAAFCDLNEALDHAISGGYRIHEADIRIALAWTNLITGNALAAKIEAERAKQMSTQMGYHWGIVDAVEALSAIK